MRTVGEERLYALTFLLNPFSPRLSLSLSLCVFKRITLQMAGPQLRQSANLAQDGAFPCFLNGRLQ